MPKRIVTLTIDQEVYEKAKEMNLNMSKIANESLSEAIELGGTNMLVFHLDQARSQREEVLRQINLLDQRKSRLSDRLGKLDGQIEDLEGSYESMRRSSKIAGLMRQLKDRLVAVDFDTSFCSDILDELRAIGFDVSESWIETYVNRMKMVS